MSPQIENQIAALVMEYGAETVIRAAERVVKGSKAPLILENKAQSLPIEDRGPFYRFAALRLAVLVSDEDAWHTCRAWDRAPESCGDG